MQRTHTSLSAAGARARAARASHVNTSRRRERPLSWQRAAARARGAARRGLLARCRPCAPTEEFGNQDFGGAAAAPCAGRLLPSAPQPTHTPPLRAPRTPLHLLPPRTRAPLAPSHRRRRQAVATAADLATLHNGRVTVLVVDEQVAGRDSDAKDQNKLQHQVGACRCRCLPPARRLPIAYTVPCAWYMLLWSTCALARCQRVSCTCPASRARIPAPRRQHPVCAVPEPRRPPGLQDR